MSLKRSPKKLASNALRKCFLSDFCGGPKTSSPATVSVLTLNPRKLLAKHVEKSGNCGQRFTSRMGDYKIDGRRIGLNRNKRDAGWVKAA